jgi:glycosidase
MRFAAAWLALAIGIRFSAPVRSQPAEVAAVAAVTAPNGEDPATVAPAWEDAEPMPTVPPWIVDASFYQIFPERFYNGDRSNDPIHDSLEFPDQTPASWRISPWTGDWYARSDWEVAAGPNIWDNGIFNRRYGGDLAGIIEKLDYLQDLGVNALYLNPVFYARSLHKYDGASMHHVDPYFGPDPAGDLRLMSSETSDPKSWHWTAADKQFLQLVAEVHRRGMRIIIDGVFNHTGRDFFAFADLRKNQEKSPYRDWYIVQRFDDPATPQFDFVYKGWWNVDTLPEFADAPGGRDLHAGPKQYLMDITRRWMDPDGDGDPRDGIDGWRLDVANEVPVAFWKDWNALVRRLNREAYTTAEIWNDARKFLLEAGFSATMNYHAFAYPVKGYLIDGRMSAHDFGRELGLRRREYPAAMQFALQNLIDSHDTERVASMIVNRPVDRPYEQVDRFDYDAGRHVSARHDPTYDVRKPDADERRLQRMIVLMQMTYAGAPMVYYGDEAGMWGGDDPCDRQPMVWEELKYEPQSHDPLGRPRSADEVSFDRPLFDFYRDALHARQEHPSLRRGGWSVLSFDDDAKFIAFLRHTPHDAAIVAFNRGDKPYDWQLPADSRPFEARLSTEDKGVELSPQEGSSRTLHLPALSGALLTTPRDAGASSQP